MKSTNRHFNKLLSRKEKWKNRHVAFLEKGNYSVNKTLLKFRKYFKAFQHYLLISKIH